MKIAFFEVKEWEKDILPKYAKRLGADIYEEEVENAIDIAKNYDVISPFIYSDLSEKTLKQLPNLKLIATRSTGTDHIDKEYCEKNTLSVASVPSYGEHTIAEHAFGLVLALSHNIVRGALRVREGGFSPEGLTGFDLQGKTIGVIGVGNIGRWTVQYAKAFGMKVLGVTSSSHPEEEKEWGYERVSLKECLNQADVVTIHVPYCKETHHLLNRETIALMKPGSILVNTARGPVVESEAILWALEQGILSGAGLDVLEEEEHLNDPAELFAKGVTKDDLSELVTAHLLRERSDVIITPHNAFNTHEAIERILQTTFENIQSFLAKR